MAGSMAASPRGPPRGRGASGRRAPPAGRRCRSSRTRRRRIRICPDSVDGFCAAFGRLLSSGRSAPSGSAGPRRPSAERVPAPLRIASMRPNGSGAASSRGAGARAPRPRDAHARRGRAFHPALEWADESGRTRKGRRPAPTPLNETRFLSYKPGGADNSLDQPRRLVPCLSCTAWGSSSRATASCGARCRSGCTRQAAP